MNGHRCSVYFSELIVALWRRFIYRLNCAAPRWQRKRSGRFQLPHSDHPFV